MFSGAPPPSIRAIYEIICNILEPVRPQVTICFACWIPKATNTHLKYVILLLVQQLLHECASL